MVFLVGTLLNGSYDLFVDMVKKHMSERGNIESEDDITVAAPEQS